MENVKEMNNEIEWIDFTSLILNCVENGEDIGFTKANMYLDGSCFNEDIDGAISYGSEDDEIWELLFKTTETNSYDDLMNKFVSCKWMDNENTAIIKLLNGKEYAVLRM